ETGYGYTKRGAALGAAPGCFAVAAFVEKPDKKRAEGYIASGDHYWNSGIFLFPAGLYLAELERLRPEMLAACRAAYAKAQRDLDFERLDKTEFAKIKGDSIDYAVMEHTDRPALVPAPLGWSHVRSWAPLSP